MNLNVSMLWEDYRKHAYGQKLPAFQDRELSLAFYAGIEAAFTMLDIIAGHEENSPEVAARLMIIFREETARIAALTNLERGAGASQ